MGRVPVTAGMDVGMPLRTDMRVAPSRMVMMVGGHRGSVAMASRPLLCL